MALGSLKLTALALQREMTTFWTISKLAGALKDADKTEIYELTGGLPITLRTLANIESPALGHNADEHEVALSKFMAQFMECDPVRTLTSHVARFGKEQARGPGRDE
jgi:hypothetical protein